MANNKYDLLRERAFQNNGHITPDHPCRRCAGECCIKQIPICEGDRQVILEARRSKSISNQLIERAHNKLQNSENSCGFQNDDHNCEIYPHRPIICIMTGAGGIPNSESSARKLIRARSLGIKGLHMTELTSSMCKEGHSLLERTGHGVTIQAIEDSQEVYLNHQKSGRGSLDQLIEELHSTIRRKRH